MPSELTLTKPDNATPWGFRLYGGLDFGSPLIIQRINPGSVALKCGLQIGDNISKIGGISTQDLKHKEAQDLIIKGGNNILLTICRGGEIPQRVDIVDIKPPENFITNKETSQITIENNNYTKPFIAEKPQHEGLVNKLFSMDISSSIQNIPSKPVDDEVIHKTPTITIAPKPSKSTKLTPMDENSASVLDGPQNPKRYMVSDTYKYLKDLESGVDAGYSPKTGTAVKSTPIQSKLVDILEKKQATFEPTEPARYKPSPQSEIVISKPAPTITITAKPAKKTDPPAPSVHNSFGQSMAQNVVQNKAYNAGEPHSSDTGAIPLCNVCNQAVRGKYVVALNKVWCPEHFLCSNPACQRPLQDVGFVQENGQLYCAEDYEKFFAPRCSNCEKPIIGNVVKAIGKSFHPDCFVCKHCNLAIIGGSFHLNAGNVYCDKDYSSLFLTKCIGCNFPIEAGDNWIEAIGQNWHGECFNCTICHSNLENQGFINKYGKPYCKEHAVMAKP